MGVTVITPEKVVGWHWLGIETVPPQVYPAQFHCGSIRADFTDIIVFNEAQSFVNSYKFITCFARSCSKLHAAMDVLNTALNGQTFN